MVHLIQIYLATLFLFNYSVVESAPPKNGSGKEVLISSQTDELNSSTNYTDNLATFLQRDPTKTELLIKEAKDWAENIGLIVLESRSAPFLRRQVDETVVALFTLFPSPFPRKFFEQAVNVQTALNLLYFRIMRDYPFLKEVYQKLIKYEQPLNSAFQIMEEIHLEGIKQPLTVLFQRADYMLCKRNYEGNEKPSFELKQVLAKPGMVERFFPNPEEAPLIDAIRNTYANLWTIEEDDNNEYPQIIQAVKKNPHKFVLKQIEYAQYENENLNSIYFEQQILKSMTNFTPMERSAYILMEKLQPTIVKNHIVKYMNVPPSIFEEVTPELGIFGTLLGNIIDGKVLHNVQLGHQMKTKLASENEGGIACGKSVYDSAYLVD